MASVITSVELRNGITLPYVEQGDPDGVPMLLLHGWPDSWRSFEPVLPHLPASIHAFAPTQRGHGDASKPADGYLPRDFAADVAAFMEAVELERAIIVGHSMGSYVTQRFAMDYPERTLGVVLMGSFPFLGNGSPFEQFCDEAIWTLSDPIDPALVREFQVSTAAQPVSPLFIDTVVAESLKVPARVWKAVAKGLVTIDQSAELPKITAPTLIAWGDQDELCLRGYQDALLATIPNARLVVYEGCGHSFHWEEPQRFAAELATFATSIAN